MRQMYAHVDSSAGKIVAINSRLENSNRISVALDPDLAMRFANGQENPNDWLLGLQDDKYVLRRIERQQHTRVEVLPITEIKINPLHKDQPLYVDRTVVVLVDREAGELLLHYDGEYIKMLVHPIKIYATREGDPSYLKCALSLDVNILDAVLKQNDLASWPNPLRVTLTDGTIDLSLFAPTAVSILAFEKSHA